MSTLPASSLKGNMLFAQMAGLVFPAALRLIQGLIFSVMFLFIYFKEWERYLLVHSINAYNSQGWPRTTQEFHAGFLLCGWQGPKYLSHICCLPRTICRKLDWKQRCHGSNCRCSWMWCRYSKLLLNLLQHKVCSMTDIGNKNAVIFNRITGQADKASPFIR